MSKDILYPLRRIHGYLYEEKIRILKALRLSGEYRSIILDNPNTIFLCMTPEHGNLGDHAIANATLHMLRSAGISWIEVTDKELMTLKYQKLLGIMNGYPIAICGGGNLGTLWMNVETLMRETVRRNPRSRIVILPNTIFYEDSSWGREELEKSQKIYNRHPRLRIYAREETSYDFMKPVYRDVKLVPDMVLSMDRSDLCCKRKGCVLCLRSDLEKTRNQDQEAAIRAQAQELFGETVTDSDMVAPRHVTPEEREALVEQKLIEFASAELVITDRLHGMIFCAITGTPCIVVDSKSPKVRGCYEWIRHLEYIRFADDVEQIAEIFRRIPAGPHRYDNRELLPYFEALAADIRQLIDHTKE